MTRQENGQIVADLAGFAFKRPLSAEKIAVPAIVEIQGDNLAWKYEGLDWEKRYPSAGLLTEFLSLASPRTTSGQILRFARAWGVLELCRHGEPGYHGRYQEFRGRKALVWCVPFEGWQFDGIESLAGWRKAARRLRAFVDLSAALSQGEPGSAADWRLLNVPEIESSNWGDRLEGRRYRLAHCLNNLLVEADSRIRLKWFDEVPELKIGGSGLWAALAAQLVLEISDGSGLLICSKCKAAYKARRKPERGRRNFCLKCGPRAAQAAASHDYRERVREAQRLARSGVAIVTIAKRLSADPSKVASWVRRTKS